MAVMTLPLRGVFAATLLAASLMSGCASTRGLQPALTPDDAGSLAVSDSFGGNTFSAAAWPTQDFWRAWGDPRGLGDGPRQAVGYKELFEHFAGRCTLDEAVERIKINSRRLAKHQRTWLRRLSDADILDVAEDEPPEQTAARLTERIGVASQGHSAAS